MPELPEAETIARGLQHRLGGRTVAGVDVLRGDILHGDGQSLAEWLPHRRVVRVGRRAKRVVIDLAPQGRLVFRLGMTGRLTLHSPGEAVAPHTHLRIRLDDGSLELRFCDPRRFGGVWSFVEGSANETQSVGEVGIEPLDATFTEFTRVLDRRRQIKALLLDQRVIAGLGNIYSDEALHAAGIHPLRRADALDVAARRRLYAALRRTLRRAIRCNGSTLMDYRGADGAEGSFQRRHRVYQRAGRPCGRCGTAIQRIVAAGRSSFLCPTCQPRPRRPTAASRRGSSPRPVRPGLRRWPGRRGSP